MGGCYCKNWLYIVYLPVLEVAWSDIFTPAVNWAVCVSVTQTFVNLFQMQTSKLTTIRYYMYCWAACCCWPT